LRQLQSALGGGGRTYSRKSGEHDDHRERRQQEAIDRAVHDPSPQDGSDELEAVGMAVASSVPRTISTLNPAKHAEA
jgi:hypothetical protein